MITTDIESLLTDISEEQLVTAKSNLPAGKGIIVDGQVKHVITSNFKPTSNKKLVNMITKIYNVDWKYAYFDNQSTNFAFCGVIKDSAILDPRGDLIQLGIEILNSYNQRSGVKVSWVVYHHKKDCWVKTGIDVDNTNYLNVIQSISKLSSIPFGFTDIPEHLPNKIKHLVAGNMNGHHDAYDFILALAKVSTTYWEHTSYELSRKASINIFNKLINREN